MLEAEPIFTLDPLLVRKFPPTEKDPDPEKFEPLAAVKFPGMLNTEPELFTKVPLLKVKAVELKVPPL